MKTGNGALSHRHKHYQWYDIITCHSAFCFLHSASYLRIMGTVKTSVRPLFVKDSDMRALGLQSVTTYEMCTPAIRASSPSSLEGVQKINDL